MKIIILGGGGFLGHRLAGKLMANGHLSGKPIVSLTLIDQYFPENRIENDHVEYVQGDFTSQQLIADLLKDSPDVIFHLAAIVSGEAEKNFDLGMEVNLRATLHLLEQCRSMARCPRIVFASSCAVYGGDVTRPVVDTTAPQPRSSYGTQKAMAELLINDYSRRGFVDGVSLRLPTIAIRPGKANAATSSFVSAIIREPLNGQQAVCPVPPETEVWVQSPQKVISNFIHAAEISADQMGPDRVVPLPGLTVSMDEMMSCLETVAGKGAVDLVRWEKDEFLQSIVLTWPPHFDIQRGSNLGFKADDNVEELIRSYIDEEQIVVK